MKINIKRIAASSYNVWAFISYAALVPHGGWDIPPSSVRHNNGDEELYLIKDRTLLNSVILNVNRVSDRRLSNFFSENKRTTEVECTKFVIQAFIGELNFVMFKISRLFSELKFLWPAMYK